MSRLKRQVRRLSHVKQSKIGTGNGIPLKSDGNDGDILVRSVQNRGIYLFFKYNGIWYNTKLVPGYDQDFNNSRDPYVKYTSSGFMKYSGKGLVVPTTEPSNPVSGNIYWNTTLNTLSVNSGATGWYIFSGSSTSTSTASYSSSSAGYPLILIENLTASDSVPGLIKFIKTRGSAATNNNDDLGSIQFHGHNNAPADQLFAEIKSEVVNNVADAERGTISLNVAADAATDNTVYSGFSITGTSAEGVVDATIGAGAASLTTVAGDIQINGHDIKNSAGETVISINADQDVDIGVGTLSVHEALDVGRSATAAENWADGWHGYDDMILLTPSDFLNNTIQGRSSFRYLAGISLTGTIPAVDLGVVSGTGAAGLTVTNNINANLVATAIIPRGYNATGAQIWATGAGGAQPTFFAGYKTFGENANLTASYSSAQNCGAAGASFGGISFDANGDNGDNDVYWHNGASPKKPRIIALIWDKFHADDELWAAAIYLDIA